VLPLKRRVAWLWPVLLGAGLVFVVVLRMWSGWATRPMAASTPASEGIIGAGTDDTATVAQRIRQLETAVEQTRQALANLAATDAPPHHAERDPTGY